MATFKLTYFQVRGRAEHIRTLILDQEGQYVEQDCLPNWKEMKPTLPFGQTPCLEDGSLRLVQSNAILRYLGRKFKIYGSSDEEAYHVDMVNDGVEDLRVKYLRMIYQNYEAGKGPYIDDLPNHLKYFEKLMESKQYILGDKCLMELWDQNFINRLLMTFHEFSSDRRTPMATFKLTYFRVRGRAEYIRTLILDQGGQYEEQDCEPNWKDLKETMPFGQTPCLEDGSLKLVQSNAILRYLGRKYKIYGSSDEEAYRVDMINDGVEDLRVKYFGMIYQNYEAGKGPYIDELPNHLKYFEKFLENRKYILGEKVSWADYNLFDLLDIHIILSPQCLDAFPNLKAYHSVMLARPGVQKRRATDDFKKMPINGNGKQ